MHLKSILIIIVTSSFSLGTYAKEHPVDEKFIINASQLYPYSDNAFNHLAPNSNTIIENMPSNTDNTKSLAVKMPTNQSYNKFFQSVPQKTPYNLPNVSESKVPTVEYALDKNLARISD